MNTSAPRPQTPSTSSSVRRVNVNFSTETYDIIVRMAERKQTTMTEVLRQAISLASFIDNVVASGGRILVDRGGKVSELLIR